VVGDAQTELGMYDEALESIQQMVSLRPDLSSYSRVSYQRELHGLTDGAIEAMEQALQAGGQAPSENTEYIRVLLGNLHFATGDVETAERLYSASLQRLPGFVWALAGMGRVHAAEGRFEESIAAYQRAIDTIPLPEFVIALGETQEAAGRTAEAQSSYELVRVIQALFAENGVDTDLELALFEANHGTDPEAAVRLAQEAYDRQPNIRAADTLAWALHRAGRSDDAGRYVTEALRLGTEDAQFHYHAGAIAAATGDAAAARRHLTQALDINPHFSPLYAPDARRLLDGLGGEVTP
jgi:tetratricopeptide (TPR) repeat protein